MSYVAFKKDIVTDLPKTDTINIVRLKSGCVSAMCLEVRGVSIRIEKKGTCSV